MSAFDPVPTECIIPIEDAREFISDEYLEGGTGSPRELSLQVLVDENPLAARELFIFQQFGHGEVRLFFEKMKSMFDERRGRHVQQVIAAACLHPEREAGIDLASAATVFMERRGSAVVEDLAMIRMMLGNLSMNSLMNVDENIEKVQAGRLYVSRSSPPA